MVRMLSWLAFGIVFLMISPQLRDVAMGCVATGVGTIVRYSPWSYIAAGLSLLIFAMISNYRYPSP